LEGVLLGVLGLHHVRLLLTLKLLPLLVQLLLVELLLLKFTLE
jgi:hypothetical protein